MGVYLNNPSGFQRGMIISWYGTIATIPSGWQLCNGTNGSPDLRNRFVICADADSGGLAKTSITGAPTQWNDNPLHYHDASLSLPSGSSIQAGSDYDTNAAGTTGANTLPTLSPYFALAYIMKL